jgi:hypothetical protein
MKKVGIYPGNFQPADRSHCEVYKKLKLLIGENDVFIATTDREPIPEAPLNFGDKEQIWVRHGVPTSHIIKVQSLPTDDVENEREWRPQEIYNKFSGKHIVAIIALNPKEAELFSKKKGNTNASSDGMSTGTRTDLNEIYKELSSPEPKMDVTGEPEEDSDVPLKKQNKPHEEQHKDIWLNSNGEPSYFQPYKGNENDLHPSEEHAYVTIMDDTKILGYPVSTTNIRNVLGSSKYNDNQKKKFFRFVFGWFDAGLYQLMVYKFRNAYQVIYTDDKPATVRQDLNTNKSRLPAQTPQPEPQSRLYNPNKKLQEMVYTILKELVDEDYSSTINSPDSSTNMTDMNTSIKKEDPSVIAKEKSQQKINLVQQKKELEAKDKQDKQQRDNYFTTVKNYDQFQKKNNRDAIDNVNKQLSQPTKPIQAM